MLTTTTVPTNFGTGGAGLAPGGASPKPTLETILRDHQTAINADSGPAGTALTDGDENVSVAGGAWRTIPTLTGNRTKTLVTTGSPKAGDQITITRTSTAANTVAIVNGGPGAGTLYTMVVSKVAFVKVQFDGTNWALREVGSGG